MNDKKEPQHIVITFVDGGRSTEPNEGHVPSENEKYYDEIIAPKLLEVSKLCEDRNMPFLASVEYDLGSSDRGTTSVKVPNQSLDMVMIQHLDKVAPNIDKFMMGVKKYCVKNNIDTSSSIYLSKFGEW